MRTPQENAYLILGRAAPRSRTHREMRPWVPVAVADDAEVAREIAARFAATHPKHEVRAIARSALLREWRTEDRERIDEALHNPTVAYKKSSAALYAEAFAALQARRGRANGLGGPSSAAPDRA